MAIAEASLQAGIAAVREIVGADGGDVTHTSGPADPAVTLDLILADAECAECVMPRQFLETVALDLIRAEAPGVTSVTIADPRESETA